MVEKTDVFPVLISSCDHHRGDMEEMLLLLSIVAKFDVDAVAFILNQQ